MCGHESRNVLWKENIYIQVLGDFFQSDAVHADGNVSDVEDLETESDSDDYVRYELVCSSSDTGDLERESSEEEDEYVYW